MAVPTPEQRRGGGLLPGLRISGPPGREAAKKPSEGNLTELVRIKIASFGGKKVGVFGQAKKNFLRGRGISCNPAH